MQAHPTEVHKQSILSKHNRIAELLMQKDGIDVRDGGLQRYKSAAGIPYTHR